MSSRDEEKGAAGGPVNSSTGGAIPKVKSNVSSVNTPQFKSVSFPTYASAEPFHSSISAQKTAEHITPIRRPLTIPKEDEDYLLNKR